MSRGPLRASAEENRFVLRAELQRGDERVVSYGFDITPGSAFVVTDIVGKPGDELGLRLSFPRLLDPVDITARIAEQLEPSGPGAPAGLRLVFEPQDKLAQLLVRAHDSSTATPFTMSAGETTNGWRYRIASYQFDQLTRRMSDLLKAPE